MRATYPRPQIEVSHKSSCSFSIVSQSSGSPVEIVDSSIAEAFSVPTRHGTHLPHDSFRKKRTTLAASGSMGVSSATTTSAPEPNMLPASSRVAKSIGTSARSAGRKLEEAPPGANAFRARPPLTPPASSISSRTVVPMAIS